MKKKYSKKRLERLEKDMQNPAQWEEAHHIISYKGPTSIRFGPELLSKLQEIAHAKNKPINRLVNDYVRAFVESEYELIHAH